MEELLILVLLASGFWQVASRQPSQPVAGRDAGESVPEHTTKPDTVVRNPATEPQAKINQQGSEPAKHIRDSLVSPAITNWALVIVGAVGIIVAIGTLKIIEKQTKATQLAAEAATESAIAARKSVDAVISQTNILGDTARRQLRAYICVAGALLKFPRSDVPEVQVHLKNSGQTPAYEVRGWIHMWIEEYPLRIVLPEPPEGFNMSKEILGPGSSRTYVIPKNPPVPPQSLPLLGTVNGTIFVYGEVRYRDAFGVERYTKYRLIHGGTEGSRAQKNSEGATVGYLMKPDVEGNEAN